MEIVVLYVIANEWALPVIVLKESFVGVYYYKMEDKTFILSLTA